MVERKQSLDSYLNPVDQFQSAIVRFLHIYIALQHGKDGITLSRKDLCVDLETEVHCSFVYFCYYQLFLKPGDHNK